jgi:hypothetical protein
VTHDRPRRLRRKPGRGRGRTRRRPTADEPGRPPTRRRGFSAANVSDGRVVRPEAVALSPARDGEDGDGVVESAVRQGPTVRVVVRLDDGHELEAAVGSLDHPRPGDRVNVEVDPAGIVRLG